MTCINCRSAQLLSYESRRSAVWGRWTPAASHPAAALSMHVSDSRSWKGPLRWEGSPVRPAPPRHSLTAPNMEAKCHLQFIIELELLFFLSRDTIFYSHISYEKRRRKTDTVRASPPGREGPTLRQESRD